MSAALAAVTAELGAGRQQGLYNEAALAVARGDEAPWVALVGRARWFDLASLTKPLATAALALKLHAAGRLPLDAAAAAWLPAWRTPERRAIRIETLLRHRAGLVPYERWYEAQDPTAPDAAALRAAALAAPLAADPEAVTTYSDTGFIAIGAALEALLAPATLAAAFAAEVAAPLGVAAEAVYGPLDGTHAALCAATGDDPWRGRALCGEVHDNNAFVLGPAAPHAGLFATAGATARLAHAWLRGRATGLLGADAATVRAWTDVPADPGYRPLAWDRPGPGPSQAGRRVGARAFGHLGFTGTSVWCDPEREATVVLLTNRIAHDPEGHAFRAWRPQLYDRVWAALDAAPGAWPCPTVPDA